MRTTDPLALLCEEWVRLKAARSDYDAIVAELGDILVGVELPEFERFREITEAITDMTPRTLDGLIAQQAVLRSIEPGPRFA